MHNPAPRTDIMTDLSTASGQRDEIPLPTRAIIPGVSKLQPRPKNYTTVFVAQTAVPVGL